MFSLSLDINLDVKDGSRSLQVAYIFVGSQASRLPIARKLKYFDNTVLEE